MARRQLRGARALVTGASSGIGAELARALARRGARLLLTARRADRLEQLTRALTESGADAACFAGDVTDPAARRALLADAAARFGALDALINNAGVGAVGPWESASPERLRRIMEVNFFAPLELTREALPLLRRGDKPVLVNVGSVLGHRAVPYKSEYCASKFALHGFTDALQSELAGVVDVLLASPSTTVTEFGEHLLENTRPGQAPRRRGQTAAHVAERVARAMERGQREIILSWGGTGLVWLDRLLPDFTQWLIRRWLVSKPLK